MDKNFIELHASYSMPDSSAQRYMSRLASLVVASKAGKHKRLAAFVDFTCNLGPRKLKYVHVTISCLDGHPRKFIRKKLQNDQTSKIL